MLSSVIIRLVFYEYRVTALYLRSWTTACCAKSKKKRVGFKFLLFFYYSNTELLKQNIFCVQATGGSGDYIWSSNDADIVTVNKNGEITTAAKGEATVTAADRRNQLHKGVAKVQYILFIFTEFFLQIISLEKIVWAHIIRKKKQ